MGVCERESECVCVCVRECERVRQIMIHSMGGYGGGCVLGTVVNGSVGDVTLYRWESVQSGVGG